MSIVTIEAGGGRKRDDGEPVSYTVLSRKAIWWFAAGLVVVAIAAAVGLLLAFGRGDAQQRNQLDAIRTAGTIVVGSGGAAALLLAARRQRSTEIALKQKDRDQVDIARAYALQERVAENARQDAVERRITELYTKAADQLRFDNYRDAAAHVSRHQSGGLKFHDLRHSYGTWLADDGVPVNKVQKVMGQVRTFPGRLLVLSDGLGVALRALGIYASTGTTGLHPFG